MHRLLPVRFATQNTQLQMGDELPTFRAGASVEGKKSAKVLNIDISIESEERPMVQVKWVHNKSKSFDRWGQQPAQVRVQAGRVEEQQPMDGSIREMRSARKLSQTEISENLPCSKSFKACVSKGSLADEKAKGRTPLAASNINRLTTKQKINLSANMDCQRPSIVGEVRNFFQEQPQYERIQDQLKHLQSAGRGYRYQQLISRRGGESKPVSSRQLAHKQTEQAFQQCLGRLRT